MELLSTPVPGKNRFIFRLFIQGLSNLIFLSENRYLDKQLIMNQGFGAFYSDVRQGWNINKRVSLLFTPFKLVSLAITLRDKEKYRGMTTTFHFLCEAFLA